MNTINKITFAGKPGVRFVKNALPGSVELPKNSPVGDMSWPTTIGRTYIEIIPEIKYGIGNQIRPCKYRTVIYAYKGERFVVFSPYEICYRATWNKNTRKPGRRGQHTPNPYLCISITPSKKEVLEKSITAGELPSAVRAAYQEGESHADVKKEMRDILERVERDAQNDCERLSKICPL